MLEAKFVKRIRKIFINSLLLLTSIMSVDALANTSLLGQPGEYFLLSDRWTGGYANTKDNFEFAQHSSVNRDDFSFHWTTEYIETDPWFRIKNRKTGEYLHLENRNGIVSVGAVPRGYWSSHWRVIPVSDDYFRLQNRWLSNDVIHVEQRNGSLQHSQVPTGFWSSHWSSDIIGGGDTQGDAKQIGQWSNVTDWPLIAIHGALTADGKVVTYGTDANGIQGGQFIYDVWNPNLGSGPDSHSTLPNSTATDLFCSAQVLIPDTDQMMMTGGDIRGLNDGRANTGVTDINIFSSNTNSISSQPAMNFARWYPTTTTLASGEILIQGGIDAEGRAVNTPEIYSPTTRTWRLLSGSSNDFGWWYPRSWVAPNGKIFGLSGTNMYELDTDGAGSSRRIGTITGTNKYFTSTSVMFRPGRILQIGGGTAAATSSALNASAQVTEYNIQGSTPLVSEKPGLTYPRLWATGTVLPDGKVLVTGGSAAANTLVGVANAVEIYNPDTNQWTLGASAKEDRLYHSIALLLPDASVLVAGGGAPGPIDQNGQSTPGNLNAEIYYPPYFFDENNLKRTLDTVATVEKKFTWNQAITVLPRNANTVANVNLVRLGSVTHSNNMEQRFIPLTFSSSGNNTLTVNAPANANVAPPGYYMLFVVDSAGIPSKSTIVSISGNSSPPSGEDYFQISNLWTQRELHTTPGSGVVQHSQQDANDLNSHWYKEYLQGQNTWFRLRNRSTGESMHIEPRNGIVAVGNTPAGFWSSHWSEQIVGNTVRFVNRWLPNDRIHVQQIQDYAQHGSVPDGYWSAMWNLNSVN